MDPALARKSSEAPTTSEAILGAARRRFARFGPRKTTMGEVARDAGCSRATLYSHFPSKQHLYSGLLERETRRFLDELAAAAASPADAGHKLRAIVAATVRSYADNPVLRNALAGDEEMTLERVAHPVIEVYEARVVGLLSQVLEEGIAAGSFRRVDADAVAYLMYQLGRVLVTREVAGRGDYPFARILSVMDDVVARGIANPAQPGPKRRTRAGRTRR